MDPEIKLYHLAEVDSTNSFVKRHCLELADGTLVYADVQTAGRGRLDRKWVSARGNFFGTLLMKKLPDPFLGTMVVSLAALDVLNDLAPELRVWLKWPNDLYVEDAKLAGILSEAVIMPDNSRAVAVGLGVNLALSGEDLAGIDKPAASVEKGKINPEKFAFELAKYAKMYYIMGMSCSKELLALWQSRNEVVGMELVLELTGGKQARGVACAVADDGALVLRDESGAEKSYYCGDVSVSRESVRLAWERRRTKDC
ncbi:MAG: biotin--[acetyl-CoA-carboxylase] ligase [Lentisphaerae bacterium]|nr:biotin--[acetyl-CoA-carboxylase] ligase [Lentisphaerota bacterium]